MFSAISHEQDIARRFFRFIRLGFEEKLKALELGGTLLDTDVEGTNIVKLYFLHGFFVEQIESVCGTITELIPYKNGYRIYNFLN